MPKIPILVTHDGLLDSRFKHAGMTDFGLAIYLMQQAAGKGTP